MQTFQKFRNIAQNCLREPVTRHSLLITLTTSPHHVWIAETLTTTHVSTAPWYFHPEKFDYLITYLITIYYYVDYLSRRSKNLKTENWKRKTEIL
jgi:hypothetical protein